MGVPAFYRWLTEKYPKVVQDVLEERVQLLGGPGSNTPAPFDATRPNPSGLECDALYIDMNGIIHPCSHPENGPQPKTEQEMYENVCRYIDRLFRAIRPRKLLYLAIDGVAPRAKMNQQRSRRFRAAQEMRELAEMERHIKIEMQQDLGEHVVPGSLHDDDDKNNGSSKPWDSNVITPGTPFMLRLAEFVRFYIRKRLATDAAWRPLRVIFSDASIPGEGEHKIMAHIRLQRSQPGYNVNTVHILHGLDADLIMLGLATHEAHFYISREEVLFGRQSMEQQEQRQTDSGFRDAQTALNEAAGGAWAMALPENMYKPLQRVSIPILREYLGVEFSPCLDARRLQTFAPSLERVIDDFVFLCFFVGNDFLPHLPSLDIRDGALDFLLNVYKRILPSLGDYITKSGGNVNLSHVNVILAEVGAIEDYVFQMKHDGEQRERQRRQDQKAARNSNKQQGPQPMIEAAAAAAVSPTSKHRQGRAGKILQRQVAGPVPTRRNTKQQQQPIQVSHSMKVSDNAKAAQALRDSLFKSQPPVKGENSNTKEEEEDSGVKKFKRDSFLFGEEDGDEVPPGNDKDNVTMDTTTTDEPDGEGEGEKKKPFLPIKRKRSSQDNGDNKNINSDENGVGIVGNADEEFDADEGDDDDDVVDVDDLVDDFASPIESVVKTAEELDAISAAFKEKVKAAQQQKLDNYAKNVQDNVRLHEAGWKDRYYSDKCKADDVSAHGGREHLFRSYIVGLCWTMKYYYEGCVSYKWFYPFHYAPFASDLKNVERFQKDCRFIEKSQPFAPVEQLMAVLPSDSDHAIPTASRWLMSDPESPIIDFYPTDVPVDPNGKAMPWLWVVLLPFIDEDRLLQAMSPTMTKWTKEELLCNARGLDDGYLYVHESNPLVQNKLAMVVAKGKTARDPKTRLTQDVATAAGFSGSVRPPLSNELYPVKKANDGCSSGDDDYEPVTIPVPPTANLIDDPGPDGLFTEPIEVNTAVCVAFTEPPKLPHKSILLPGAKPPRPVLTAEDKRIRRPRFNRGGSIANLGMTAGGSSNNNNSHQQGFGSMNIGTYERDLAAQTGRGREMYQTGNRAWGAMEPTPKRFQAGVVGAPLMSNPFLNQPGGFGGRAMQQGGYERPPWNSMGAGPPNAYQHPGGLFQGGGPSYQNNNNRNQQTQPQQRQYQNGGYQQHQQQPHLFAGGRPQQQFGGGYQQQQHLPHGYNLSQQHQQQQQQQHQQQPQQRQGHDFRSFNHAPAVPPPPPPPHFLQQQPQQQQQRAPAQRSRANPDAVRNLREQLSSTLRNRRPGGGGQN